MDLQTKQSKVISEWWVFDKPTVTSRNIYAAHQDHSEAIWLKSPHSKAEALPLATTAPKAGVSKPIAAQTELSADNHSFGGFFEELLNISQMCVVKKEQLIRV